MPQIIIYPRIYLFTPEVLTSFLKTWEEFDECPECYTAPRKPCYNMKMSSSLKLVIALNPHRGRKKIKRAQQP